ncbi:MAG: single-stranded DNA-binding protein, partial [Chthoniobacterales bacterium]|nr:single-stranded DNA-binding protein [Chthoniobacterales bacterium]
SGQKRSKLRVVAENMVLLGGGRGGGGGGANVESDDYSTFERKGGAKGAARVSESSEGDNIPF